MTHCVIFHSLEYFINCNILNILLLLAFFFNMNDVYVYIYVSFIFIIIYYYNHINVTFYLFIIFLIACTVFYKAKSKIQKTVTPILEMYSMFFCHHCF